MKRRVTHLSSFDKSHTPWISSASSTWRSRSKISSGLRMPQPTRWTHSIWSYLITLSPAILLPSVRRLHATTGTSFLVRQPEICPSLCSTRTIVGYINIVQALASWIHASTTLELPEVAEAEEAGNTAGVGRRVGKSNISTVSTPLKCCSMSTYVFDTLVPLFFR